MNKPVSRDSERINKISEREFMHIAAELSSWLEHPDAMRTLMPKLAVLPVDTRQLIIDAMNMQDALDEA